MRKVFPKDNGLANLLASYIKKETRTAGYRLNQIYGNQAETLKLATIRIKPCDKRRRNSKKVIKEKEE